MKFPPALDTGALRLRVELAYRHYGMQLPLAILVVVVAILVWGGWVPGKWMQANKAASQLASAQAQLARGERAKPVEPPLTTFRNQLLPQAETIAQVRMILQVASNSHVSVIKIDMRRQPESAHLYSQLQIVMPVRGDYQNLKDFCLNLLEGIPALSIDQITLKQEDGQQPSAQLSLSLWQEPVSREGAR